MDLTIVTPVYNDQISLRLLLEELSELAIARRWKLRVVAVDDGSIPRLDPSALSPRAGIEHLEVLHLTHNIGHQRAIAVGLCHASRETRSEGVVVIDSDGEDRPRDIASLVSHSHEGGHTIVFAERRRRSASLGFRFAYGIYRRVFRILTGRQIKFGNFCYVPMSAVKRLVNLPQLWNHFSASLLYSGMPYRAVPIERGARYDGTSKMSGVSLIAHGLSSISVFVDSVLVRIIIAVGILGVFLVLLMIGAIALRLSVNWVTPGWTTTLVGTMLVILVQSLALTSVSAFIVLQGRAAVLATPLGVYKHYIEEIVAVKK